MVYLFQTHFIWVFWTFFLFFSVISKRLNQILQLSFLGNLPILKDPRSLFYGEHYSSLHRRSDKSRCTTPLYNEPQGIKELVVVWFLTKGNKRRNIIYIYEYSVVSFWHRWHPMSAFAYWKKVTLIGKYMNIFTIIKFFICVYINFR